MDVGLRLGTLSQSVTESVTASPATRPLPNATLMDHGWLDGLMDGRDVVRVARGGQGPTLSCPPRLHAKSKCSHAQSLAPAYIPHTARCCEQDELLRPSFGDSGRGMISQSCRDNTHVRWTTQCTGTRMSGLTAIFPEVAQAIGQGAPFETPR
ncbi:hypothetical protein BGZ61DRAFT_150304 [Ilyonectria robusta]|uniref:uncharacterized protein n=1 Tax=Ilyonectria robusta TaxID=1079257 RepID=UPI001E8D2C8C|nr:uncharacterized protein BGZ61DRAFT_150304 [Ilyonectria robusta]KAH8661311.1 hypothetical protein BGZ61DRAFT_150304 [Ilyonectria robusta]